MMKRFIKDSKYLPAWLLGLLLAGFLIGCATIEPGNDPLIVRAEQAEMTAKLTFDLILNTDHTDRGFWRTNAPAFHAFCEWLRQPQVVWQTNSFPRCSAMIINVNDIKNVYRSSSIFSNDLIRALVTLEGTLAQASAWSNIVTNR